MSEYSYPKGMLGLTAGFRANSSEDTYPMGINNELHGGLKAVKNWAELLLIPNDRLIANFTFALISEIDAGDGKTRSGLFRLKSLSTPHVVADWEEIEFAATVEGAMRFKGFFDPSNYTISDSNSEEGHMYIVEKAPAPGITVTDPDLFGGVATTVQTGDQLIHNGTIFMHLDLSEASTVTWDTLQNKPQVIIDYVAGTVISHSHLSSEITVDYTPDPDGPIIGSLANLLPQIVYLHRLSSDISSAKDDQLILWGELKNHLLTSNEVGNMINEALNTALANYVTKTDFNTALSGKQDTLSNQDIAEKYEAVPDVNRFTDTLKTKLENLNATDFNGGIISFDDYASMEALFKTNPEKFSVINLYVAIAEEEIYQRKNNALVPLVKLDRVIDITSENGILKIPVSTGSSFSTTLHENVSRVEIDGQSSEDINVTIKQPSTGVFKFNIAADSVEYSPSGSVPVPENGVYSCTYNRNNQTLTRSFQAIVATNTYPSTIMDYLNFNSGVATTYFASGKYYTGDDSKYYFASSFDPVFAVITPGTVGYDTVFACYNDTITRDAYYTMQDLRDHPDSIIFVDVPSGDTPIKEYIHGDSFDAGDCTTAWTGGAEYSTITGNIIVFNRTNVPEVHFDSGRNVHIPSDLRLAEGINSYNKRIPVFAKLYTNAVSSFNLKFNNGEYFVENVNVSTLQKLPVVKNEQGLYEASKKGSEYIPKAIEVNGSTRFLNTPFFETTAVNVESEKVTVYHNGTMFTHQVTNDVVKSIISAMGTNHGLRSPSVLGDRFLVVNLSPVSINLWCNLVFDTVTQQVGHIYMNDSASEFYIPWVSDDPLELPSNFPELDRLANWDGAFYNDGQKTMMYPISQVGFFLVDIFEGEFRRLDFSSGYLKHYKPDNTIVEHTGITLDLSVYNTTYRVHRSCLVPGMVILGSNTYEKVLKFNYLEDTYSEASFITGIIRDWDGVEHDTGMRNELVTQTPKTTYLGLQYDQEFDRVSFRTYTYIGGYGAWMKVQTGFTGWGTIDFKNNIMLTYDHDCKFKYNDQEITITGGLWEDRDGSAAGYGSLANMVFDFTRKKCVLHTFGWFNYNASRQIYINLEDMTYNVMEGETISSKSVNIGAGVYSWTGSGFWYGFAEYYQWMGFRMVLDDNMYQIENGNTVDKHYYDFPEGYGYFFTNFISNNAVLSNGMVSTDTTQVSGNSNIQAGPLATIFNIKGEDLVFYPYNDGDTKAIIPFYLLPADIDETDSIFLLIEEINTPDNNNL